MLREKLREQPVFAELSPASLRDHLGKGERRQGERVKKRVHRHGNENGTAPFVSDRETNSENEERRKRRKMRVHRGKKQRVCHHSHPTAEISFHHAIEKNRKKNSSARGATVTASRMIRIRCSRVLEALKSSTIPCLSRTPRDKFLRHHLREQDQRVCREQQHPPGGDRPAEPDLGKTRRTSSCRTGAAAGKRR